MTLAAHALRFKLATAVALAAALVAGHASAKNHDCQAFKVSGATFALHDRAPGPALRGAN